MFMRWADRSQRSGGYCVDSDMSTLFIAAGVAVGTPLALLSLACLAAASAYRQQALHDAEAAKLWARSPTQGQPIAPVTVMRPTPRRRARVPASCTIVGKGSDRPRRAAAGRPR
jgi:hypothetical protein